MRRSVIPLLHNEIPMRGEWNRLWRGLRGWRQEPDGWRAAGLFGQLLLPLLD
ncbi:MAG: hypothetical protein KDA71_24385 [Planctomycetales bacterium]|nr:hypothetical protein [Planctomycetales bacterium]